MIGFPPDSFLTAPRLSALLLIPGAFLLDAISGDPHWFPHPVRGMGFLAAKGENLLRRVFPGREYLAGTLLTVFVVFLSWLAPFGFLRFARGISPWAALALELILADCCLAARQLAVEAGRVYRKSAAGDLPGARRAVSMIVGRDTERLSLEGVNKAAIETVAESLSDGVIAPMCYLALGGVPLAFAFKAASTLDSMIAYKNSRYIKFGRSAAKLDDALNFLPARISALLIVAAAAVLQLFENLQISNNFRLKTQFRSPKGEKLQGLRDKRRACLLSPKNAWKILRRDRFKHASPNSGHPEAAAAGALGIALAGNAWYGGELEEKPLIGDNTREVECEDIKRAIALEYTASLLFLPLACALRFGVCYGISLLISSAV